MQEMDKWLRKELRLPAHLPARDVIDVSTRKLQGRLSPKELDRLWHLDYLRQDLMNYETISPSQLAYIHEVRKTLLALEDESSDERNQQSKEKIYV